MEKVPPFVLGMAKHTIEARARERGDKIVTAEIIDEVFTNIMPASAKQAMGMEVTEEDLRKEQVESDTPPDLPTFELIWDDDAIQKVMRIPISFIRDMAIKRIEEEVKKEGTSKIVTMEQFEKHRFSF